jgi:hypothetical protein
VGHVGRPPAARRVASFRTTERFWAEPAIDALLNFDDIVVNGIYVDARSLSPKKGPVWRQLRQILARHCIATPVTPPEAPPWWANGVPTPTGMTGSAG